MKSTHTHTYTHVCWLMTCFILLPHTLDLFKTSLIPNAETNCAVLASGRYGLISRGYLAEVKVGYGCGCGRDGAGVGGGGGGGG